MSIKVLSHQTRIVLSITDIASVEDLKREIDDFTSRLKSDDKFSIEVAMIIGNGRLRISSGRQVLGNIQDIIVAFEAAVGNRKLRPYLEEQGISRSTWYNWKAGRPIGRDSLEKLIGIAPTNEVRDMLVAARK